MLIILLLILLLLLLLIFLIILFFIAKIHLLINWQWDEENKSLYMETSILHITVYRKEIDFMTLEVTSLLDGNVDKTKALLSPMCTLLKKANIEKVEAKADVATEEPDRTAYVYVMLKSLADSITAMTGNHENVQINVSANFSEETFESVGECMISFKLSKTIKELIEINRIRKG
ncbi:hypothetical protein SH601_12085 [Gracilibacillus sp. S3-1-1]|uniref:Uncharacterized protein n=1 Tax=Gracilibacillus pellucidus TaxID=3095368 RepID=A0ACC6M7H9_9BACI|nr:hypothetical protein [Gracilibacillus sp. S3-1-1]MDX8046722.1 hypothetical protein [Gracilibacillus sp. S3-1-1]